MTRRSNGVDLFTLGGIGTNTVPNFLNCNGSGAL